MDTDKLYRILAETTVMLRKGEVVTGTPELVEEFNNLQPGEELKGGGVIEIFAMPHVTEAKPELELVDVHFATIGVDKAKAETRRADFMEFLNAYPFPNELEGGPSYIAVGATIGDQGAAFQMFALGKVLGIWDVITPAMMGIDGPLADQMAGAGYIMCTGYRQPIAA